ncbi:MAG: xanthine dehydrogenase accessory protein XdhC [Woeseia sp.]
MNEWIDDLREQLDRGNACVLVTIAGVRGSAPRETGAKMVVTARETIGTIGGGQLEYQCAQMACERLRKKQAGSAVRKITLGANLGQCCGGAVEVLFESFCAEYPLWLDRLHKARQRREPVIVVTGPNAKFLITAQSACIYPEDSMIGGGLLKQAVNILTQDRPAQRHSDMLFDPVVPSKLNIAVFGAGHVGTATVKTLSALDCNIRWIDGRKNIFPDIRPGNVQTVETDRPEREVAAMPPGSCYLVMTHSHPLDQEIVYQVLNRGDFGYCGLIGSVSKRRNFERRLRQQGLSQTRIDRLTCPIGIGGIGGKKPVEIAIAIAAEILQITQAKSAGEELPENVTVLHE